MKPLRKRTVDIYVSRVQSSGYGGTPYLETLTLIDGVYYPEVVSLKPGNRDAVSRQRWDWITARETDGKAVTPVADFAKYRRDLFETRFEPGDPISDFDALVEHLKANPTACYYREGKLFPRAMLMRISHAYLTKAANNGLIRVAVLKG